MSKPRILIIDDEAQILEALKRALRNQFTCQTTVSPLQALETLKSEPFDLILSDVRMREMDGIDLLRQCQLRYPLIPRVALTGYADMELCQNAVDQEIAMLIVSKPWDNFELKNLLRLVVRLSKVEQENKALKGQALVDS